MHTIVKIVFPSVVDVGCFSHTLDLVGDKLSTPVVFHSLDRSLSSMVMSLVTLLPGWWGSEGNEQWARWCGDPG